MSKKRIYQGIPYDIIGTHVIFNYDNQIRSAQLELGKGAAKTIATFISQHDAKVPLLSYSNNHFGDWWKSCWYGEIKVTKENDQLYVHLRYQEQILKVECYKNPFHLATAVLKGDKEFIQESFKQIQIFQKQKLKAGVDYTISHKGILSLNQ